jgi:hypothetical protein
VELLSVLDHDGIFAVRARIVIRYFPWACSKRRCEKD